MSERWAELLLLVFLTHMPYFAWRYRRTGELRFAATTVTFALLSLTYGLRVFTPGTAIGDFRLYEMVRVVAWMSALVSVGMLVRHWIFGRSAEH